jgi:hypothetical protein
MKKKQSLDMSQLFGLSDITDQVDITTPKLAVRLGAKVGTGEPGIKQTELLTKTLKCGKLFGFEAMATEVDFSDSFVASRIGAKIGGEPESPVRPT